MVTIKSVVYCDADDCPGHETVTEYPGKQVALTDNPALPLALVDDEEG